VHSVLSHRRPRTKRSKITLLVGLLSGLLVAGAIGAPMALAQVNSWAVLNPNRTIYAGQATTVNVLSGAGAARTAGMLASLQAATAQGWKTVDAKKLATNGRVSFTVKPRATTKLRVGILGRGMIGGSASNVVTITVSNRGLAVVAEAAKHRGKMYQFGAAGPYRFDCSGYTQYVFKRFGRSLPHSATQQGRLGVGVSKAAARPGDLLVFGSPGRYYHAAIYAGNGAMWDASTSGQPVALRRIYSQGFAVRRLV
jgi:cell wall-associated NlpC family hydrolase